MRKISIIMQMLLMMMLSVTLIVGCGDTSVSNMNDSSALSESNTTLTIPECTVCEDDIKVDGAYERIIILAKMFIEKLLIKNESTGSDAEANNGITVTVEIINDLIADAVAELNEGADSQEIVETFETSLEQVDTDTQIEQTATPYTYI